MPLHDTRYQHWDGVHRGIWSRRATIARNALKGCWQNKWTRYVVSVCWTLSLTQAMVLFLIGQLLVKDSSLYDWVDQLHPQMQALVRSFVAWLEVNPKISVGVTQSLLFSVFAWPLRILTLVAIALAIPHLVTRDLGSQAITIYAAKALTRMDYILGKLGGLLGLMALTWLGPLLAAWFLGNLLGPSWHFFWHSRAALGAVLLYVGPSMVFLGLLALGISAISAQEKATVSIWIGLWLLGNSLVPIARETRAWLKYASLTFDLDQISLAIFDPVAHIRVAQENVPLVGMLLQDLPARKLAVWAHPELTGALIGLGIMLAAALFILYLRIKPE